MAKPDIKESPGTDQLYFQKCIVVLAGPPLVGKSTLGRELAGRSNLVFLDVDEARRLISPPVDAPLSKNQEVFAMLNSYQKNHERARDHLLTERPVILTATYSRETYHEMLKDLAQKTASPLRVFQVTASIATISHRIQTRQQEGNISNVRSMEAYIEVKNRYQPIEVASSIIDTEQPLQQNIQQILESLSSLKVASKTG